MPSFLRFPLVAAVLSPLALAACATTGEDTATSLAMAPTVDLALPDTVSILPSSYTQTVAREEAYPAETVTANAFATPDTPAGPVTAQSGTVVDKLITKYAAIYEVPETLVRSVVKRESTFNPRAYNRGHWGLMQIKHATARGMGYDGPANGLLDAETNLKYAVKYLRGAYLVAGGDHRRADRLYQTGYYYDAKRKGLLEETGLGTDRRRMRRPDPAPEMNPMAGGLGPEPIPGAANTAPAAIPATAPVFPPAPTPLPAAAPVPKPAAAPGAA
ncbi:lytic transglycosylase domain-containing protein [Mesorhizobium sp. DCY119]|nr:lytic transglycosylase domain-containing protein [Mesorhizobium sp. DCY119]